MSSSMFSAGLYLALMAMPSLHEVPNLTFLTFSERVFAEELIPVCEVGPIIASLEVRSLITESWAFTTVTSFDLPSDAVSIDSVLWGHWKCLHDWLDPASLQLR